MDYEIKNNNILLSQSDLDLDETLDCGQAFRWKKIKSDFPCTYSGSFLNKKLTVSKTEKNIFILHDTSESDFLNIWADYFDLNTDYSELKKIFSQDETLAKACKYAGGIRLLRQDSWECLISFIISQNNNIPRIKGIIDRLCSHYDGRFPSAKDMSSETPGSLDYLRSGFRAKYICDAVQKVNSGEVNLDEISEISLDSARAELKKIKGVGAKVAECVLLYGMHRTEAFPVDVWIKRVMEKFYPDGLPDFVQNYAGIAQQYLFHYIRTSGEVSIQ